MNAIVGCRAQNPKPSVWELGVYAAWIVVEMNLADWVLVVLSTGIIFAILGRRLLADVAEWRKGRASARSVNGTPPPAAAESSTTE